MKFNITLIFIFTLFLNACITVDNTVELKTKDSTKVIYRDNKELLSENSGLVYLNASYLKSTDEDLVFEIEIQNFSGGHILVDPALFEIKNFANEFDPAPISTFATDPETKIRELQEEIQRKKRSVNPMFVVGLALIAADIAIAANEAKDNKREGKINQRNTYNNELAQLGVQAMLVAPELKNEQIQNIENKIRDTQESLMPKITLFSSESIKGLVYFKKPQTGSLLNVNFKIEDRDFNFDYKMSFY